MLGMVDEAERRERNAVVAPLCREQKLNNVAVVWSRLVVLRKWTQRCRQLVIGALLPGCFTEAFFFAGMAYSLDGAH